MPAEKALLPTLVGEEHLLPANSLNALNRESGSSGRHALGGVLLGTVGFRNVVIIDAASYAAAALLIALVAVAPAAARVARGAQSRWRQVREEWVAGLSFVARNSLLRNLFIVVGVGLLGDAILSALLAPFAQDVAGFSATDYGWVLAARGVGGLFGGLLIAKIGRKLPPVLLLSGGTCGHRTVHTTHGAGAQSCRWCWR